ncbi:MAG: hypothetical protein AAGF78_12665 [Pseudomonadota bacterium]
MATRVVAYCRLAGQAEKHVTRLPIFSDRHRESDRKARKKIDRMTAEPQDYLFERRSRNGLNLSVAVFCFIFIGLAVAASAPWWLVAIAAVPTAAQVATLVVDRRSTVLITERALEVKARDRRFFFLLHDIDRLEIQSWSESADVYVHTTDGSRQLISHLYIPPTHILIDELEKRGVRIERN